MNIVRISNNNPVLETLSRSWTRPIYSDQDGLGSMGSLHEAGDALVALALWDDAGPTILGSGVMVGPGLALTATHVLSEFESRAADPVLLTFLPSGARAWLPRERVTVSGPSAFGPDRTIISDISLLSCTLNSEAIDQHPLTLATLQVALPLLGERLWGFGYRHSSLVDQEVRIAPLVTSGLVTAVFPQGRGERMHSACVEVQMDSKGGMSGGPVINAEGNVVGIVSSSFDGGPSYVTLIWEALRMNMTSRLPSFERFGEINLIRARDMGLVRLIGSVKQSKRGDTRITLTDPEVELMLAASGPLDISYPPPGSRPIIGLELKQLEERWLHEIEENVANGAVAYLSKLQLQNLRIALSAAEVPDVCCAAITDFAVDDLEGLEDPELHSARLNADGTTALVLSFDLRSVVLTIFVPTEHYNASAPEYDRTFTGVQIDGSTTSMELVQPFHFEAEITLNDDSTDITDTAITFVGVMKPKIPRGFAL